MYCGKCGTPYKQSARFCERCGLVLGEQAAAATAGGGSMPIPTAQVMASDVRVRGAVAQPSGEKNAAAVALVLSFFIPGAGQFYNGDNKRGALMLVGALVSLMLVAFTIGVFTGLAIWIWSMVNAYNVACERARRAEPQCRPG